MKTRVVVCLFLCWLTMPLLGFCQTNHFEHAPWETIIAGGPIGFTTGPCNSAGQSDVLGAEPIYQFLTGEGSCPPAFTPAALRYSTTIDASAFAPNPEFHLEIALTNFGGHKMCVRLFNVTANTPVTSSEICQLTPFDQNAIVLSCLCQDYHLVSAGFQLPSQRQIYTLQWYDTIPNPSASFVNKNGDVQTASDEDFQGTIEAAKVTAVPKQN